MKLNKSHILFNIRLLILAATLTTLLLATAVNFETIKVLIIIFLASILMHIATFYLQFCYVCIERINTFSKKENSRRFSLRVLLTAFQTTFKL